MTGLGRRTYLKGVVVSASALIGVEATNVLGQPGQNGTPGEGDPPGQGSNPGSGPSRAQRMCPAGTTLLATYEVEDDDQGGSGQDGSPFLDVTVRCTTEGPEATVTNTGNRTIQVRDIDSAGQDVIGGRPILDPGESLALSDVENGDVVLRAYDPDTGDPLASAVTTTVDCDGRPDDAFSFVEGEDVITFTSIDRNGEGEIVGFDWTSTSPVAVVTVKSGTSIEGFEGGFEDTVDLRDGSGAVGTVAFCAPRGGRAVLCELDMDGVYDTEMHYGGDPSMGDRCGVVQVTSGQTATTDYAHSMVNVLSRVGERIRLDDLETLQFDYFEGADNEGTIPDELFISLLTPDDDLKLAVRHFDESPPCQWWETFDALDAIGGGQWKVEDIGIDDLRSSTAAANTARNLRDSPDETASLLDTYGDATLAGVGFGAGNTRNTTVIDRYFDDLQLRWNCSSITLDFPAVVPTDIVGTRERGNTFDVTVAFQQPEPGLSFDDVDETSVTLNAFGRFAPPIELGAVAQSVNVEDGTLEARFRTRDVDELVAPREDFIVSGDFDHGPGSAFFGIGAR